jgi:hypothetical protein
LMMLIKLPIWFCLKVEQPGGVRSPLFYRIDRRSYCLFIKEILKPVLNLESRIER